MKRTAGDLVHAHLGRAAVILGGGESLPEQLARCQRDAIFISANQHGCLARRCDYIVATDPIEDKEFRRGNGTPYTLRGFGVPIISTRPAADYWLFDQCLPSSGVMAAWMAWVMGCAPILLAGMDCYQGDTYFHDPQALSSGRGVSLARHVERWAALPAHAPGGQFRALGEPLLSVFQAYDPNEPAGTPCAQKLAVRKTAGVWVQFSRACSDLVAPRLYAGGERAQLSRKVAERCVKAAVARPLEECTA